MIMDYWCALWFWPIEEADKLPTRDEYLLELQFILQGTLLDEYANEIENGQKLLFQGVIVSPFGELPATEAPASAIAV